MTETTDAAQLLPMLDQARENAGQAAAATLADAGYHSAPNLAGCADRDQPIAMPETHERLLQDPYHQERFVYREEANAYCCPQGQLLTAQGSVNNSRHSDLPPYRVYQASGATCRGLARFREPR